MKQKNMSNIKNKISEQEAFDRQTMERINNGFVPDLRRLVKVDWFYNNEKRDPEILKIHWLPRIKRMIKNAQKAGSKVLEIGCGMGMIALEAARHGLQVTGVDISPLSIEIANKYKNENPYREGFGSLEYLCADFYDFEFEASSFDSIIFYRTLHHFKDVNAALEKVNNLLKPNGLLILSEPVRSGFNKNSANYAALLRLILPTWLSYEEKLNKEWTAEQWEIELSKIEAEYKLEGEHRQSPNDNSTSELDIVTSAVRKYFDIKTIQYNDSFIDKLIGGLRGDERYRIAKFLKFYDQYLIDHKILNPTSIELVAKKQDH
jgi:2-polyprenyl-3-methyl-5-hydroxy-6-metoxy-1,4-benzoquinol methylase